MSIMQGYADGVDGGYDDGAGGAYSDGVSNNTAYADAQAYPASGYAGLSRADDSASIGTMAGTDAARANVDSLARPLIAPGTTRVAQHGDRRNDGRGMDSRRGGGVCAGHGHSEQQLDEGCCCLVM